MLKFITSPYPYCPDFQLVSENWSMKSWIDCEFRERMWQRILAKRASCEFGQ